MESANRPKNELLFVRELDAPRELVFDVWTHSEHLSKWWGPDGFTVTSPQMQAAPGVSWRFTMHGPDGRNYLNNIIFIAVNKPEYIIYKHSGEADTEDVRFEVKIRFETIGSEASQKTRLTMNMIFETPEELQRVAREYGAIEGAEQHLNRLTNYILTL